MINFTKIYTKNDISNCKLYDELYDKAYDLNSNIQIMKFMAESIMNIFNEYNYLFDDIELNSCIPCDIDLEYIHEKIQVNKYIGNDTPNTECINDTIHLLKHHNDLFNIIKTIYTDIITKKYYNKDDVYIALKFIICNVYNTDIDDIKIFIKNNELLIENEFFNNINDHVIELTNEINQTLIINENNDTYWDNIDIDNPFYFYPESRKRLTHSLFIWSSLVI